MEVHRVGLPPAYQDADLDHLAQLMGLMLERVMALNDRIPLSPESITRFHSAAVPPISILDYLRRIVRFTNVEPTCLLIVLHYIDQICARQPTFTICSLTCHRFLITAVALASKTLCDAFCSNTLYARIGGISTDELARLEREFLYAIDWRLTSTQEVLQLYYENLVAHSSGQFCIIREGPSSSSSDSDLSSRTPSPVQPDVPPEPSTILRETAAHGPELPRAPATVEQSMAFEQFQRSRALCVEPPEPLS